MNDHTIEFRNAKFSFTVNNEPVTVDSNVEHKTIVVFKATTVFHSMKICYCVNDAKNVLWEYIESIQYSEKKSS